MRAHGVRAGIAGLILCLAAGPAGAHEIRDYISFSGNQWVAFKFAVGQSGSMDAAMQAAMTRADGEAAAAYLIGDGKIEGWFSVYWLSAKYVYTEVTGDLVAREYQASGTVTLTIHADHLTPGEYTVLMISAATEGKDGAAWIMGEDDLQVTGRSNGDQAFFYLPNEFGGTINASLDFPTVAVGGSVSKTVSHGLWGEFHGYGDVCRIHYDGPDGTFEGGGTFFGPYSKGAAGQYTFANDVCIDHIGGGTLLWGADVELP